MNEYSSLPQGAVPTAQQRLAIEEKCLLLLSHRAARFTLGASTSLPQQEALRLLHAVQYVVGQHRLSPAGLAAADWDALYHEGVALLQKKISRTRLLYLSVQRQLPPVASRSLTETLASVGTFFRRYDVWYYAAECPCDIDYQLCHPVQESLLGVDYVSEYLRCLLIENRFLRCFSPAALEDFFGREQPDYRELILGLYQPVTDMALGLALAGEDPRSLVLSPSGRQSIAALFSQLHRREAQQALQQAAEELSRTLGITALQEVQYLAKTVQQLLPRIMAALGRTTAL